MGQKSIISKVESDIKTEENRIEKNDKTKSKIKYIFVALLLLAGASVLGGQMYNRFVPNQKYKAAVALMESDKKEALLKFEELGDYKNSEYYCSIIYDENPLYRFDHTQNGDVIKFGKYNFDNIEWVVISKDESNVTLITKEIIDAGVYPKAEWFTTFMNKAFSSNETSLISSIGLIDKETKSYISEKSYAKAKPSKKALENTSYKEGSENGYCWWIDEESGYSYEDEHRYIDKSGSVSFSGEDDTETLGIRPVIKIKLK